MARKKKPASKSKVHKVEEKEVHKKEMVKKCMPMKKASKGK